jgi:hypothetical protein
MVGVAALVLLSAVAACVSPAARAESLRDAVRESLAGAREASSVPLTMAWFCSQSQGCAIRALAEVGGQLLLVDSGSSALAFCAQPDPSLVQGVPLTINGSAASQCFKYGDGGHGWYGPSFEGDIACSDGTTLRNVTYSVMSVEVGEDGNTCGAAVNGTVGTTSPQGGIIGISAVSEVMDGLVLSSDINTTTWPASSEPLLQCFTCQCPKGNPGARNFLTDLSSIADPVDQMWAIRWDGGELGPGSASLLWGAPAALRVPRAALFFRAAQGQHATNAYRNFYSFVVTKMSLNGQHVAQKPFFAMFDTGTPSLSLPTSVLDAMKAPSTPQAYNLTVSLFGSSTVDLVLHFPADMVAGIIANGPDEYGIQFQDATCLLTCPDDGNWMIFGLTLMRWFQQLTFNTAKHYVQFQPRAGGPLTAPFPMLKTAE